MSLQLKTPYSDGTTHILLTPQALLQRLCALVPRPRAHRVRYHGTFAPNSPYRDQVVPANSAAPSEDEPTQTIGESAAPNPTNTPPREEAKPHTPSAATVTPPRDDPRRRVRWILWQHLVRRVFAKDPLACPKCSGTMRFVSVILKADAIIKILACLELPAEAPRRSLS